MLVLEMQTQLSSLQAGETFEPWSPTSWPWPVAFCAIIASVSRIVLFKQNHSELDVNLQMITVWVWEAEAKMVW